jgi:hypothetical protein
MPLSIHGVDPSPFKVDEFIISLPSEECKRLFRSIWPQKSIFNVYKIVALSQVVVLAVIVIFRLNP